MQRLSLRRRRDEIRPANSPIASLLSSICKFVQARAALVDTGSSMPRQRGYENTACACVVAGLITNDHRLSTWRAHHTVTQGITALARM